MSSMSPAIGPAAQVAPPVVVQVVVQPVDPLVSLFLGLDAEEFKHRVVKGTAVWHVQFAVVRQ